MLGANLSSEELLELYKASLEFKVKSEHLLSASKKIEAAILQKLQAADDLNNKKAFHVWEKLESDKIMTLNDKLSKLSPKKKTSKTK